jgi:hypothetical protein
VRHYDRNLDDLWTVHRYIFLSRMTTAESAARRFFNRSTLDPYGNALELTRTHYRPHTEIYRVTRSIVPQSLLFMRQ